MTTSPFQFLMIAAGGCYEGLVRGTDALVHRRLPFRQQPRDSGVRVVPALQRQLGLDTTGNPGAVSRLNYRIPIEPCRFVDRRILRHVSAGGVTTATRPLARVVTGCHTARYETIAAHRGNSCPPCTAEPAAAPDRCGLPYERFSSSDVKLALV